MPESNCVPWLYMFSLRCPHSEYEESKSKLETHSKRSYETTATLLSAFSLTPLDKYSTGSVTVPCIFTMSNSNPPKQDRRRAQLPRSMTFGLEIEMLVAAAGRLPEIFGPQAPWDDPHPGDGRRYPTGTTTAQRQYESEKAVADCLVRAGLDNVYRIHDGVCPRPLSAAARASHESLPKVVDTKYHNWRVMNDGSLAVEEWIATDSLLRRYTWSGVEIASAVFGSSAPAGLWVRVAEAQRSQIAKVCQSLTSSLRIRFSETCGLHLHLGLGGEPIPGDTVRRFVTTMWLVEHAVLALCAPWRVDNTWSQPITKASLLASEPEAREMWGSVQQFADLSALRMFLGADVWSRLSWLQKQQILLIWSLPLSGTGANNLVEAISTLGVSARGTVNIRGALLAQDDRSHDNVGGTIEIRYACGTLVSRELVSWTNLFMRLFQLCHWHDETNAVRLTALLHGVVCALAWSDRYAGHELLRHIGLGDDVRVWEAAEERWASEKDYDQVRKSPFVSS
jgi:hypothetical protein